jgi:hypothetical protein
MTLRVACGAGTDHFDSERYLREREAFGSHVMGWQSPHTIDIYDQSRDGERTLAVLSTYQQSLSKRQYLPELPLKTVPDQIQKEPETRPASGTALPLLGETLWMHDAETLDWIKKMQRQSGEDQ